MAVHDFDNLEKLKEEINNDLEEYAISSNRFPVRYIFLNSHEELREVINYLSDNAKIIELSSMLFFEDSWLTDDQIIKEIKDLNENTVVVPFSEFVRFSSDKSFTKIFNALAEIENRNMRIYIPLVGLWERFEELFWENFVRKDHWAPVWKLNTEPKKIHIYQIDFDFNEEISTNELKLITNTKEWFELWKHEDIEKIISLPEQLSMFFNNSLPDKTFSQEKISSPKEYLSKIFDIHIDILYDSSEKQFWDNLLIDLSKLNKKNISLKDVFIEKVNLKNIDNLDVCDYLDLYFKHINSHYTRWIIKNFFINSKKYKNSYLRHCFNSSKDLSNAISNIIFLEIFKMEEPAIHLDERRKLLKLCDKHDLSFSQDEFENLFDKFYFSNDINQLSFLTDTTELEKIKIMDIVSKHNIHDSISILKDIFPELYYYLDWNLNVNNDIPDWILDYFKEYSMSKVSNKKSDKLNTILSEKNSPSHFYKWYYKLQKVSNIETNDRDYVVWIDALGAEWLPLLVYYLNAFGKKNNKKVKYKSINSVNLPSATSFNVVDCDKKFRDLDDYIHDHHYKFPYSLLGEMEEIRRIAKEISKLSYRNISIFSDHGFSFLCTKQFGADKKYGFKDSGHEGRYFSVNSNDFSDCDDFIVHETESIEHDKQKFIITLRHVSLYNTPSHEVHGGATPEEILVPYILFGNEENTIIYEVSCDIGEMNVSMEKELPITVYPKPEVLPVAIYNNERLHVSEENDKYIIKLNADMKKGLQKIILKVNDDEVGELEVNIKKGGMEEEEYDFG